ncbi:MAG: hypothetical protein R2712_19640 [Vicinamibacterales bacterium]
MAWITAATALFMVAAQPRVSAAQLQPETVAAWDAYVRATEARITRELASDRGFLATDFTRDAAADRRAVARGEIPVAQVSSVNGQGEDIEVPGGLVHHWRGSVFIPGATIDEILDRVANPRAADTAQEDVLSSRVLARGPGSLQLYLRLQRSQIVTVVYDTEHAVKYHRYGPARASSRSVATKIAEVSDPGGPNEAEKPIGNDRGFLWKLNSYWRYSQVDGGVIVELESISLSRSVPTLLRVTVRPLINMVARGSMERTLASMRDRLAVTGTRADGGQ